MLTSLKLLTILSLSLSCFSIFLPHTMNAQGNNQAAKNFFLKDVAPGLKTVSGNFTTECEEPYAFIGYDYINNNSTIFNTICDQIEDSLLYRLEGGASIQKVNGSCTLSRSNVAVADKFLCALWNISSFNVVKGQSCPSNYSEIQGYDVEPVRFEDQVCNAVPVNTSVIAGFHGSVYVDYQSIFMVCAWKRWDDNTTYNSTVCVDPYLIDIKPIDANFEKACGDGFSMVTMDEVYANQDAYLTLNLNGAVRLSGGALVDYVQSDKGFYLYSFRDDMDVESALCANVNRTSSLIAL